jgi:uncharacterized protein (DUF1778 family)
MSHAAPKPTSIRLSAAEKRQITAAALKRGLTPTAYIKRAALEGAKDQSEDQRIDKLERISAALREAVEDVVDARDVALAWDRHVKSKNPTIKAEDVWRELDV